MNCSGSQSVFLENVSHENVESAGESIFVVFLNGNKGQNLDSLRSQKFIFKANTSSTCVQVHSLPPTRAAARFHSFRVYLQVQTWMANVNNPTD